MKQLKALPPEALAQFELPGTFTEQDEEPAPGNLIVLSANEGIPGFAALIQHLENAGYQARQPGYASECDFTIVNGSIGYHDDDLGWIAICMIGSDEESHRNTGYQNCGQLITASGPADMDPGSVVVFDSSEWHAWISGCRCLLATICIQPKA